MSDKQAFQKAILAPLERGGAGFAKPLQSFLKAYCLRRTDLCLNLPPSSETSIILEFSPSERLLYTKILSKTRQEIDRHVSSGQSPKYNKLFIAIMKMRMRCNYGTFSPSESKLMALEQMHIETECESCLVFNEENNTGPEGDLVCPECNRQQEPRTKSPQIEEMAIDQMVDASGIEEQAIDSRENESHDSLIDNAHSTKLWAVTDRIAESGPGAKRYDPRVRRKLESKPI